MKFEIIETDNERTYIIGQNELDRIKRFEEHINEFIKNDTRDLIFDLEKISKLDSMSLSTIIRIKNSLNANGRDIRLINLTEDIYQIIELAGLESLL